MPVENLQGGWVDLENGVLHRKAPNEPETKKRAPGVPLGDKLWRTCAAGDGSPTAL
jgi:hypothetical protein